MTAYAIAHFGQATPHRDLIEYVERIQSTLDPYEGRFLVHGGRREAVEGTWPGDVVMIRFPDMETARAWYGSPAYQELIPLRTPHLSGDIVLVEGVPEGYDPAAKAEFFRAALEGGGQG
ncbi:DUF1330 domain-containing protein [Streptomyces sp. ODS28]|uniref:DUF1330 domain-containing protein n=1 Tax=Streptomyces sp. ODS28 TaxID=3136688 RepID=UPI0031EEA64A